MATGKFGVGVIGCGTVGGGVVKLLIDEADNLRRKTGVAAKLRKAVDIDPAKRKATGLPAELLAENAQEVLDDPESPRRGRGHWRRQGGLLPGGGALAAGKACGHCQQGAPRQEGARATRLARKHNVTLHFEALGVRRHSCHPRLGPVAGRSTASNACMASSTEPPTSS